MNRNDRIIRMHIFQMTLDLKWDEASVNINENNFIDLSFKICLNI